jgi:chemosensory pili system protein ChpA (sensor histidine kinase/response regulator)
MAKPLALIIEDAFDLSFLFAKVVELAGYDTEVIQSGDIALDRLGEVTPDLVVLDLNLPKVLGTDILRHIRREERLVKVHVIVVTAYQHLAEATYEQANHVLKKPLNLDLLSQLATEVKSSAFSN